MTKRIFRSICTVALAVLVAAVALFMLVLYNQFSDTQLSQLKMQTDMVAQGVTLSGEAYFDGLDTAKHRVTWVAEDGSVLYDSHSDTAGMENHLEREEIQAAFQEGQGESKRYSATLMERSLYYAERLEDGTVIRLSISQNTVLNLLMGMGLPIGGIILIALALSILLATRLARSIVNPLNELNLDDPLENEGYDELSPLLRRIDSQQKQLKKQAAKLQKKQDELDAVIGSMNEGIVLLNAKGQIISINPTAVKLLEAGEDHIGKEILTVCRDLTLQEILRLAQEGKRAERLVDLQGRRYQLAASPILSADQVSGIALLFFDVTERENAEQMRREFTANVSHELKTPLHSIAGFSELMANGMVKEADYIPFAGRIHTEAKRMMRLVEDIINLSHLDEGAADMQREEVELYAVAEDVVRSLTPAAEEAEVTLTLTGEPVTVNGIPQLLQAIVRNLCDNAIKYNRKGGNVTVSIKKEANGVRLCVSDTGIGIPPEHHSRIFERFYRVDKSRSKAVGGTGLGLSIVKHAALIHNAKLEMQSVPGEGTTITVRLPR